MKKLQSALFCLALCICSPSFAQVVPFESSNLPVIVIDTEGRIISNEPKVMAKIGIVDNGEGMRNRPDDAFNNYSGYIGIEYRGSSSQALFPKKNFGFETWDAAGEEIDTTLLGFPSEQDWVLHGPYSDKTLMRNKLTFDLYAFSERYSSRTRYVELVLNGQYRGVYILMEKIKRDDNRVDIAKLTDQDNSGDDLTGGYILKLDKYDGSGGGGFASQHLPPNSSQQIFFQYDEPQDDEITAAQKAYIQGFMRDFERTLKSNVYADPALGYRQYIDVGSFIDFFLINELNRNVDGFRLSSFMYKDKDSKGGLLHMGPIWDFNLAFGNADYCQGGSTQGWAYKFNDVCPGDTWQIPFWWQRLLSDRRFQAETKARWFTLREGAWSNEAIMSMIDGYASQLSEASDRNFSKWPIIGDYVWPNNYVGDSYDEEVAYLKGWIENRVEWLDAEFEKFDDYVTTGVEPDARAFSVFPNPFSSAIRFKPVTPGAISAVKIFSFNGQLVRTLARPTDSNTEWVWDGRSDAGSPLPPAIYLYQIIKPDGAAVVGKVLKAGN